MEVEGPVRGVVLQSERFMPDRCSWQRDRAYTTSGKPIPVLNVVVFDEEGDSKTQFPDRIRRYQAEPPGVVRGVQSILLTSL